MPWVYQHPEIPDGAKTRVVRFFVRGRGGAGPDIQIKVPETWTETEIERELDQWLVGMSEMHTMENPVWGWEDLYEYSCKVVPEPLSRRLPGRVFTVLGADIEDAKTLAQRLYRMAEGGLHNVKPLRVTAKREKPVK